MDRIAMLSEILAANPEDSFARYGLALEYSKAGQIEQALQEFKTLFEKNPDYTPAYCMAVISDCACALPVRRAEEMPSTSQRLASSTRLAPASACAAMKYAGV